MRKFSLVTVVGGVGLLGTPAMGTILWDNGDPNGINGYSNATAGVFGFRRTLLDDFEIIYSDPEWGPELLVWNSVWATPMGTMGVGVEISLRSDVSGTPGMVFATANVTSYSEEVTGNIFFSREEIVHRAHFDTILLDKGRYWLEATVQGPENNFWLTSDQQLNECWVNYEDLGGLRTGTEQFGVASGINFELHGAPAPGAFSLFGLAALARRRRRLK